MRLIRPVNLTPGPQRSRSLLAPGSPSLSPAPGCPWAAPDRAEGGMAAWLAVMLSGRGLLALEMHSRDSLRSQSKAGPAQARPREPGFPGAPTGLHFLWRQIAPPSNWGWALNKANNLPLTCVSPSPDRFNESPDVHPDQRKRFASPARRAAAPSSTWWPQPADGRDRRHPIPRVLCLPRSKRGASQCVAPQPDWLG